MDIVKPTRLTHRGPLPPRRVDGPIKSLRGALCIFRDSGNYGKCLAVTLGQAHFSSRHIGHREL